MPGSKDEAIELLIRLLELHYQYGDQSGRLLTQANYAHLVGNREALTESNNYFQDQQLPQAAITAEWLRQLEVTHTPGCLA